MGTVSILLVAAIVLSWGLTGWALGEREKARSGEQKAARAQEETEIGFARSLLRPLDLGPLRSMDSQEPFTMEPSTMGMGLRSESKL